MIADIKGKTDAEKKTVLQALVDKREEFRTQLGRLKLSEANVAVDISILNTVLGQLTKIIKEFAEAGIPVPNPARTDEDKKGGK